MKFEIEAEERCLGQIIRTQIKPEIKWGKGNCEICNYDPKNNLKCRAYKPIVIRFFLRLLIK